MMKRIIFLLVTFSIAVSCFGQCAMCKAVLESDEDRLYGDPSVSAGINDGIVYLMGFPYLLILGFLAFSYKDELKVMIKDAF